MPFIVLMQVNFLKSVAEDIAGKQSTEIVKLLEGKKDVNEFLIAKKLKMTINQTRNILYKLADKGLVSFIRKKDKRKGWYIYFWTLNVLKALELLEQKILDEIHQLRSQLKNRKTKRFYYCNTCNVEVGEETALLNDFTCRECGQVYVLGEQDKLIKELEAGIEKLERRLSMVGGIKKDFFEKEEKKTKRAGKASKSKKSKSKKQKTKKKGKAKNKPKKKVKKSKASGKKKGKK